MPSVPRTRPESPPRKGGHGPRCWGEGTPLCSPQSLGFLPDCSWAAWGPSAQPPTRLALRLPSSSAARDAVQAGSVGGCCPPRSQGLLSAPLGSWPPCPAPQPFPPVSPLGSKPASLPTCAWHRGELGRCRLAVGDSRPGPTWEQDGHFPSEARGLEARLQEQTSPLRAWACPGCVRCGGLGTQGSSFRPREAPSPAGPGPGYPVPVA